MVIDINAIPSTHKPDRVGSIRDILRNYPDLSNIVYEFIQNAEDANSTSIQFEVTDDTVRISNDGDQFELEDYKRICEFAQGKWGDPEKIGKFGVGFISAYHITDTPVIVSNGIRLTILADGGIRRKTHVNSINRKGSIFSLPLRHNTTPLSEEIVVEPISDTRLGNFISSFKDTFYSSMLFLTKVETVAGWYKKNGKRSQKCICSRMQKLKEVVTIGNGNYYIHENVGILLEWSDPTTGKMHHDIDAWHIFTQDFNDRYISKFGEEPPTKKTQVSVAFKLDNMNSDQAGFLYAFLPTKIKTGFKFNINAHFAPRTGRDDIRDDPSKEGQWNLWLIECIGELCVSIMDSLKILCDNPVDVYHVIPVEHNKERGYLSTIVETFINGVADKPIIFTSRHGWQDKTNALRIDENLRSIIERAGPRLVAIDVQSDRLATLLLDHIKVDWFGTKNLVSVIQDRITPKTPLKKAPVFARTIRRVGKIYRYLRENPYEGMWDDLKNTALCIDQHNVLHLFDSSDDKIYWADTKMRRILADENVLLVKDVVFRNHSSFIKNLVQRFDIDHLIEYLDNLGEECESKKLSQVPTSLLSSISHVTEIYGYLKNNRVFETSCHKDKALETTPLCITEKHIIQLFDKDDPPAYRANHEVRQILRDSDFPFIAESLEKKHKDLLAVAGIPELNSDRLLDYLEQGTFDGMPLTKAPVFINTRDKLIRLYRYFRRSDLTAVHVARIQRLPIFLTSRGYLRPLVDGNQGNLVLGTQLGSDPLKLDILLDDVLTKDRRIREWLVETLHVDEMTLTKYIAEYLLPNYPQTDAKTKLQLMRILKTNLNTIKKEHSFEQILRSSALIQCQDGSYREGKYICFKNKSNDQAFGRDYYFPGRIYSHSRGRRLKTLEKGWGKLFEYLGVRKIPHPETVIDLVSFLAGEEVNTAVVERSRKLLRFINNHWSEYQLEQEELKDLWLHTWLPARKDKTQLYDGLDLYLPELKILVGTQVKFVDVNKMEAQLANLLGINTMAETGSIVQHLLEISNKREPASVKIYEELDRRKDSAEVSPLYDREIVDISGKGNFWNPNRLFFKAYDLEFGQYRRGLPERLKRFSWLFGEIGVGYTPEVSDYVELLIEISNRYQGQVLPRRDRSIVSQAYIYLSRYEESITDEQLAELREHHVVLGIDFRLHSHADVFINDYPEYNELGFSEDPVFCLAGLRAEIFLSMLPVLKFSKAVSPRLISVENTRFDSEKTSLLRDIWLDAILRVNFNILGMHRDINDDREYLKNIEIHTAEQINVLWSYCPGEIEISGDIQEIGAFLDYPSLYVSDNLESAALYMAMELARNLSPDVDPSKLLPHYHNILNSRNREIIDALLGLYRYRPLPHYEPEVGEDGPDTLPTPTGGEEQPTVGVGGHPSGGGENKPSSPTGHPVGGLPTPRPVHYVDVDKLIVVEEEPADPDEARLFSIGASVERKAGYYPGLSGGGDRTIYDENIETESVAFDLINKIENKRGWITDNNNGRGFVGYDIKAWRGSEVKYIEVKSSKGGNCPDLSFPQLMFAKRERSKYYLYRVLNLEKSNELPTLYIIKDPWGYLDLDISAYKTKGYKENPRGEITKVVFDLPP
ncbi:hypothetical protein ES707_03224 [subsurface metagenome]